MARTLDFGKNKGSILADCEEKYLKWLVSHEKVLAERNRWACRDAKFLLERVAQVAAQKIAFAAYEARKEAEMAVKVAEQLVRANQATCGNLNTSRGFSLM